MALQVTIYTKQKILFKYYIVRTNQRLGRTARTGPVWRSAVLKTISTHNNTLLSSDRLAGNKDFTTFILQRVKIRLIHRLSHSIAEHRNTVK